MRDMLGGIKSRFSPGTGAGGYQGQNWAYLVALICFLACFVRFPGEWDNDTVAQHAQMLAGVYEDWHPPVFAAFWRALNGLWNSVTGMEYAGSGVIYVTHALMLWGGMALLVRAARGFFSVFSNAPRWALPVFTGFLLFFGLFEMVPLTRFIFKDTAMMASYILALGVMLNMPQGRGARFAAVILCVGLFFYGTAVRHNSIFALVPMLYLLLQRACPGVRRLLLFPLCLLVWGGIVLGINSVNYDLLKAKREYSLQELVFVDFWRLNYNTGTYDLPPLPAGDSWEPLTKEVFFRFYNEKPLYVVQGFRFIREYYGEKDMPRLRYDYGKEPEAFARLQTAWVDKIKSQFPAYLKMHKKIFMELMREYSFMGFTGILYLVAIVLVLLGGVVMLARKRWNGRDPAPYLLALSALLYVGPYLAILPDIQRRYLFWFFFAAWFALNWLVLGFFHQKARQSAN